MALFRLGTGMLALAVALPAGPTSAEETRVTYSGDQLTVHARGAPLTEIVTEIGRQSHAQIVGTVSKPHDVNQDVEAAPLVDALKRLLGDQNFTLRYGRGGELRAIRLLGEAAPTKPSPAPVAESPGPAAKQPPAPRHEPRPVQASRPLPDGGVLVSVRSRRKGPIQGKEKRDDGVDAASEVPGVRGGFETQSPAQSAAQTIPPQSPAPSQGEPQVDGQLTPDELQRRLRRSFLDTLTQMDDATLNQYLATPEGQKVASLVQWYAAHRPSSSTNQKANDILGRIPNPANASSPRH